MSKQLNKILAGYLAVFIILQPLLVLSADVTVDTSAPGEYQPELIEAASGTPVVNITQPTSGGVSRNLFSEYNVGDQGLILNNSTSLAKTELGGYVLANPNLQNGSARLILNEVTGTNPSWLNGYTEIAGASADIIIANPNGISINGGGFINTPHATLTTGISEWQNNTFTGLRVEQGNINIEGRGLNAKNLDVLDLYARAISVNAELWAKQLNLVVGQNRIKADGSTVESVSETAVPTLLFALDSTILGGMYADQITLIGTEKGIGVHFAGDMAASGADIKLSVDGRLEILGQITGQEDVRLDADEIVVESSGAVLSGQNLNLSAFSLFNEGSIISANNTTLSIAESLINRGGLLFAFNSMSIYGSGQTLPVTSVLNDSGRIETWLGDLDIAADELINRSDTPEAIQETYKLVDDWVLISPTDQTQNIVTGFRETLTYQDPTPASIHSGRDLYIQAGTLTNLYSTISATNNMTLVGDVFENSGLDLLHEWTTITNRLAWRKKHTKFHTQCKYIWMSDPPIIDGPYSEIIDNVPARVEAGGDVTATFTTSIGNGVLQESILVEPVSLPEGLIAPDDLGGVVSLNNELNALFQKAPDDHPYLIETRPLFANKDTFVNSDYLLDQLDYQPNETLKRVGDGFYETILLREAILQQTGRRFLDTSLSSDSDQYTSLMNAALVAANELELSVGVALNQEQIASLTHDIVWFVAEKIDGQTVLVPQLYLGQLQKDNMTRGSQIIASGDVTLLTAGMITTSGEIDAGNDLTLAAKDDIHAVDGDLSSENMTLLLTGGSILVGGGQISGETVSLQADETVAIQTRNREYQNTNGHNTVVGHTANIKAGEGVTLLGDGIILTGASIDGETVDLTAQTEITLTTIEKSSSSTVGGGDNYSSFTELSKIGSSVKGTNVSLSAGADLTLHGSSISAEQDGQLVAGGNLTITSAEEFSSERSKTTSKGPISNRTSESSATSVRQLESTVVAGGHLELYAGTAETDEPQGTLTIAGSKLDAGADLTLYATDDILIVATDASASSASASRKSNLVSNSQNRSSIINTNLKQSNLQAEGDLLLISANNISLVASTAAAGGDAVIVAGNDGRGNLNLIAGEESAATFDYSRKGGIDFGRNGGFYSVASITKNTHETSSTSSVATEITSGGETFLLSGNDTNLIGATIKSSENLSMDAGRDINILAAAESATERSTKDEKKFGLSIDSNPDSVDVFFGLQGERDVLANQKQLTAGSNLIAGGNLNISSERNLNQVGSALSAGRDLQLRAGGAVNSLASEEVASVDTYHQQIRIGITTSLNHNIGSAADSVKSIDGSSNPISTSSQILRSVDAIDRATQPSTELHFGVSGYQAESAQISQSVATSSLYAGRDLLIEAENDLTMSGTVAVAGQDMRLGGENIKLLAATGSHSSSSDNSSFKAGVSVKGSATTGSIAIGGNGSRANTDSLASQMTPVQISVGQNLTITAKRDIEMEGSQIAAAQDVFLDAGNDLHIYASKYNSALTADSHQFAAEAGLSVSSKKGEAGLYASVNGGQDQLDRSSSSYLNSHITAGNLIDLSVLGDAKIQGATLTADNIHADIGGDLLLASTIDSGEVEGDRWNAGISVSQSGSSGFSAGIGQTDGHKAWIEEQTGLIARDSVELYIGGHTQLNAAIIASETGNLKLDTNTFAYTDHSGVDTETSYDLNLGINSAGGGSANQQSGAGVDNKDKSGSLEGGYRSFDREQEVRATIGDGEIIVRSDQEKGVDSTEGINRDLDLAYEITRDTSSDYDVYVSSGSLNRLSSPIDTAKNWTQSTMTYGRKTVAAVKGLDNITEQSELAEGLVSFVDTIDLPGILVSRKNYGGLVTQIPVLLTGDAEFYKVIAILKDAKNNGTLSKLKKEMKQELDIKELTEIDINNPAHLELLRDKVDYASINGIMNYLPAALMNAVQQTGATSFLQIYNPTHGIIGDLTECAWDVVLGGIVKSGTARNIQNFYQVTEKAGLYFNVASHSQGGLLNYRALDGVILSKKWKFQFNGVPVLASKLKKAVEGTKAEYKGSYANYSGDPVLGRKKNDPVSSILGMNAKNGSAFIDGLVSFTTVLSAKTSDHSSYLCQGIDFCAGQQPLVEQMRQAADYQAPVLLPTN